MNIWFATGNIHKKAELAAILNAENSGYSVIIPADAGLDFDPEETGTSFFENAMLKARELYRLLSERRPPLYRAGDPVIADDSGICVDALDGRPGIYSARYAKTAAERNALLLKELGDNLRRSARFVCAMTLLYKPEHFFTAQEIFEGEIVKGPEYARGEGGFGYDPVLYIPSLGRTVAELSEEEKNRISHRGKAGKALVAILRMNSLNRK